MALIFKPFANSKLVFGCAQELWDLLGMLVALDISIVSRRLSAISHRSRIIVSRHQELFTSYKTSSTLDLIGAWSVQLAI